MTKKIGLIMILLLCIAPCSAQETETASLQTDSAKTLQTDSKTTFLQRVGKPFMFVKKIIDLFNDYDTTYVEPNRYHWTTMLQGSSTYENLLIQDSEARSNLSFGSRPSASIGPYLGWGIFFFGYNIDASTFNKNKPQKTEFEVSFYTSLLGGDLFYRHTGSDFSLKDASIKNTYNYSKVDIDHYKGQNLDGISMNMIGANLYYVFNRRHFSLPAAYSQSTVQRKSAGSMKLGLSISKHDIELDCNKLESQIPPIEGLIPAQSLKMEYMDYSLSVGYAYSWVFHRNWVFNFDLTPSFGYKRTRRSLWPEEENESGTAAEDYMNKVFVTRGNANINFTGRFGLVWNNAHHFAGLSIVAHNFNYKYKDLSMHNSFFTLKTYVGVNFIRKGKHANKKKK